VTRGDVLEFLRSRGIRWREDASNVDLRFARNRIRHEILPRLRMENPRINGTLAQLADLAFEEERWWRENLADRLVETAGGVEFRTAELTESGRAVARRLVRTAILRAKGDLRGIEFQHVDRIIDIENGRRLRLPGVEVTRSFDWVRLCRSETAPGVVPVEVTVPGTYEAPDGAGLIRVEVDAACANLKVDLAARIELRAWRPGDHYRPVGKSRDRKLKDMFQSARVPSWRRRFWPILEGDGKILWAREFGAAAGAGIRISEIPR